MSEEEEENVFNEEDEGNLYHEEDEEYVDDEKFELMFEFPMSRNWWEAYCDKGKRYLFNGKKKMKWHEPVTQQFDDVKPDNIHCCLYNKGNKVVHITSRKAKSSKGPFCGYFGCSGVECSREYRFRIVNFDDLELEKIPIKVFGNV